MSMIVMLTLLVIIAVFLHIRAEYRGPRQQVYIFKPLTMLLILLLAMQGQATPTYKYLIITGLLCSLVGDVFLMLPSDHFVAGLVAFLIAHLFYITAFSAEIQAMTWWPIVPLAIYGPVVYIMLASSLGKLKIPVMAYMVVILVMAWLAWERWVNQPWQTTTLLAFIGAVLFVISDTILALNRFQGEFKPARALNLTTYFAAQWLIAGSVGFYLG